MDLIALAHSPEEAARTADMGDLVTSVRALPVARVQNMLRGVMRLPGPVPMTHALLHAPGIESAITDVADRRKPDVVFAFCSGIAQFAYLPAIRQMPLVLDLVDADSVKWATLAERSRPPMRWIYRREARTLGAFEAQIVARSHTTLIATARERDALAHVPAANRIRVVENGVDVETLRPTGLPAATHDVVFCGVMNYEPNVEGVIWMAERVWPLIRRAFPQARFKIVGSNPAARVTALANPSEGILVTGYVPDVRPELWSSAVAVAPLLVARGIQNKVLEAVAAGLPAVVSVETARGLPPEVMRACAVAESPEAFAAAVCERLALSPAERRAIAGSAALDSLTWDERLKPVQGILESATSGGR